MDDKLVHWLITQLDERNWSQRELARKAGVSQTTVSQVIAGTRTATPEFCLQVAEALHEPPEMLLRLANHLPAKPQTEGLDPEIRLIVEQIIELLQELQTLAPDMIPTVRNLFYTQLQSYLLAVRTGQEPTEERARQER